MNCDISISDLQNAINFIKMEKDLRTIGSSRMIMSLFFLAMAFMGKTHSVDVMTTTLCAALFVQGILLMTRPSPGLALADLIIIISVGVLAITANLKLWGLVIMEILLLLYLIFTIRRYMDDRKKIRLKPRPEVMAFIESTTRDLRHDNVPTQGNVIELGDQVWAYRILLSECMAIFVGRDDLFAQSRDEEVITLDSAGEGAEVYIVSTQYTKWRKWRISDDHYQRYLAWKGIPAG